MPELPEVETARRGILPHIHGKRLTRLVVRDRRLRWPVPQTLPKRLAGQTLREVHRRAKYLLLEFDTGTALLHLGMSGSLRVVAADQPAGPHDHVDLVFASGKAVRLRDPRRFGSLLWAGARPQSHKLLRNLGPEPLSNEFDAEYLHTISRHRNVAIKNLIMNSQVVVGVGNIYASEALYLAGIHPGRAAGKISKARLDGLTQAIKTVLTAAIADGGTTLRDFANSDGNPGYFRTQLRVYDRAGQPCVNCEAPLRQRTLGQRSTYFCPRCQT